MDENDERYCIEIVTDEGACTLGFVRQMLETKFKGQYDHGVGVVQECS